MSPEPSYGGKVQVEVDGRHLTLSNLQKPLYPNGFTKAEVIDYYTRMAPALLPHLAGRPLTVKRYPNGTQDKFFFEKNASASTPDWVRTVELPVPGSTMKRETIRFVIVEERATLVWLANLAALELHTPQWRVGPRDGVHAPDQLVIDLDPGPPATSVQCATVALAARRLLPAGAVAKTSGNKGLQLLAPWSSSDGDPSDAALELAQTLEKELPDLVVSRMAKNLRPRKVFVDWSQNNRAKTTVSVWSLRAREEPTVSTPLSWDELEEAVAQNKPPVFTAAQALARYAADGDPFSSLLP